VIGARVEELVHEVAVRTVNFELTHQQRREEEEKGSAAHIQPIESRLFDSESSLLELRDQYGVVGDLSRPYSE
jgi:hypothetical protein